MQSCGARSQRIHLENTSVPRAQETAQKRGQSDVKRQSIKEFAVRLCLVKSSTQQVSSTCLPKHKLIKDNSRHAQGGNGNTMRPRCYTKTTGN
ncbi:hypothetical protein LEMLEM_LOCUS19702, partial [Lemmus lemmus]